MVDLSEDVDSYGEVIRRYVEDDWTKQQRQDIRDLGLKEVSEMIGPIIFSEESGLDTVSEDILEDIYTGEYGHDSHQIVSAYKDEQDYSHREEQIEPEQLQSTAEKAYAEVLAEETLQGSKWDIATSFNEDDREANIHIYDALNYEIVSQLQETVDREFEVKVSLPKNVDIQVQDAGPEEIKSATINELENSIDDVTVGPKTQIEGGGITRHYPDEPTLLIKVEELTEEVDDVLSVFDLT